MLLYVGIFIAGCIVGGIFVYRGLTNAMKRELLKRPWTEEEKEQRALLLIEVTKLSKQGDQVSKNKVKEIKKFLTNQDAQRSRIT